MFKFSKKDYWDKAICPTCGEYGTTNLTPEEQKQEGWECADCANKRLENKEDVEETSTPTEQPTPAAKPVTPYDLEFDFLIRLIKLIAKEGVPQDEIKAITDSYRPLETIDQAESLTTQIWTLATQKYQIPREWLIKNLPDTKVKKACLQISADQYNETDPEWPAQNAAEDFSDRPANSVAYAPEKQSKPAAPKKKYVSPPLGIGPQEPGNEDAGHGFYDSPGPADLGKDPKGDFPTNTWMPMGTEDMDAEYWDNVAALSKKELNKTSQDPFEISDPKQSNPMENLTEEDLEILKNDAKAMMEANVHSTPHREALPLAFAALDNLLSTEPLTYTDLAKKCNRSTERMRQYSKRAAEYLRRAYVARFYKKEASLIKKANPQTRYWIAPDGTEFPVAGIHPVWIKNNAETLKKYGIDPTNKTVGELHDEMIASGWVRISNEPAGSGFVIQIKNWRNPPSFLDDFIAKNFTEGDKIVLASDDQNYLTITDPFPSLQKAVNKTVRRGSLKKADVSGKVVNEILRLLQTSGGVTYNLQKGNLAGTPMFAVSIYPDREQIQELGNFDDISNFIESNLDLLNDPNNSFGAWANEGKVYYDVVATVPDEKEALELGRKHNQLAIFDLKNGMEIKTGVERFSFSKKDHLIEASIQKWALARQDVIDFYLLSLIPMDYLIKESKNPNNDVDGLAIFKNVVQQLRDEYITRGMEELVDEAETTRWITKIPDHKMPEQLKPYYTFYEKGYWAGSGHGRSDEEQERYPYECENCGTGLTEDETFTYGDYIYCESCESNALSTDLREQVKFCTDDNRFVCDSSYADTLENYVPGNKLDNIEDHEGHNLIPLSEGSKLWQEVMDNAEKQLKLFPRERKQENPKSIPGEPNPPPTHGDPTEETASLKTAGEGAYGVGGPFWQAPNDFDGYSAMDFFNIFEYAPWAQSYGGPAWAEIAKTIAKMQQTTDLSSLIVLIDHYHDLGHNTGKLLDKFPEWHQWFKALLDMKARPGSLRQLLSGASNPVRNLVVEYFRVHGRSEALRSTLYKRLTKTAEESPLTQEQQDEIAASSSPVYNIALNNFFEAFKRGHGKDRSFAYAVDSVKNLEKIDPKKLVEFANTYLQGLI